MATHPAHRIRAWLARFLSERARLFLLSLGLAVVLWFYVGATGRQVPEGTPTATLRLYNIEVTVAGLQNGWTAQATPPAVDFEIRWPAESLLGVRPADVQAIADVSALEAGAHRVNLRFNVPSGVTSVQVTPPAVLVVLTRP
jgi:YbbR domain-containing protein